MDSVDYVNTFITVAPDSAAEAGSAPLAKENPTVAERTHAMIVDAPYVHTSGDVIFTVWADRRDIPETERQASRAEFFSKGQACLRSSDLGKRYGWGVHSDAEGRVAIYGIDSPEYAAFASGTSPIDGTELTVRPAMRSKR